MKCWKELGEKEVLLSQAEKFFGQQLSKPLGAIKQKIVWNKALRNKNENSGDSEHWWAGGLEPQESRFIPSLRIKGYARLFLALMSEGCLQLPGRPERVPGINPGFSPSHTVDLSIFRLCS